MSTVSKLKILIPDAIYLPPDIEQGIFGSKAEVVAVDAKKTGGVPDELWHNCSAVLAYDTILYDAALLSKLKKCKVLVRAGVGYDNVDLAEAKKRNIIVCNVPDFCTEEVADHTMAFLLALVRYLPEYARTVQQRKWKRENDITFRLKDKVLGIIGMGRIGTATALRAQGFGLKVVYYDPYIRAGYDKVLSVQQVDSLEELASVSDIISVHTPLTSETRKMIDGKFFKNVKKGAILINTARGPIVDISALEQAMKKNIIKACGLDVLPVEPSDNSQKLIVDYEKDAEWLRGRLAVTPHSAFYSRESLKEIRVKSASEAKRVLEGKKPKNCVSNF